MRIEGWGGDLTIIKSLQLDCALSSNTEHKDEQFACLSLLLNFPCCNYCGGMNTEFASKTNGNLISVLCTLFYTLTDAPIHRSFDRPETVTSDPAMSGLATKRSTFVSLSKTTMKFDLSPRS